jgi:carboxymethylenebutenolidase
MNPAAQNGSLGKTLAELKGSIARVQDAKENTLMKAHDLRKEELVAPVIGRNDSSDLGTLFDGHIAREFADHDVNATMETMIPEPYVHCVPIMTGGFGARRVRRFYSEHFINQIPKDATVTPISRTVGNNQVVDEFIISFTHDTQWDYLLPGIPPTGKRVELPHVVVMKFENGKVAHEHIWWDQATLLVQVGLLDPVKLPVAGVEQARELLRVAQKPENH